MIQWKELTVFISIQSLWGYNHVCICYGKDSDKSALNIRISLQNASPDKHIKLLPICHSFFKSLISVELFDAFKWLTLVHKIRIMW